ncbi:MAG: DMT family transporter [Bacteroidota bacterium]
MVKWLIFLLLCLIWGSSFILMKLGMKVLSPYEVASLRMLSAGLVLLPFFPKAWRNTNSKTRSIALLTGLLGSFFAAILFCLAETSINSSVAAILNATTPLFVMIVGLLFFKRSTTIIQVAGILIGFIGVLLLFLPSLQAHDVSFTGHALLVLLATVLYGFNVNIANKSLQNTPPLYIATLAFGMLLPLDALMLFQQGFFHKEVFDEPLLKALASSVVLGVLGTAFATWLFYILMQKAGPLFSSMVTYGLPFVAIGWGVMAGETISSTVFVALILILSGVYLANKKKSP